MAKFSLSNAFKKFTGNAKTAAADFEREAAAASKKAEKLVDEIADQAEKEFAKATKTVKTASKTAAKTTKKVVADTKKDVKVVAKKVEKVAKVATKEATAVARTASAQAGKAGAAVAKRATAAAKTVTGAVAAATVSKNSTVAELRAAAKANGIAGYSSMTKPQLIKVLKVK